MNKLFKSFKIKDAFKFLSFEIIFICITLPLLVYYGPFHNVRNTLVKSFMTTMNHQWMAEVFLSDEKINQIMSEDTISAVYQNDKLTLQSNVNVHNDGTDIELYEIKGKKYDGKLLIVQDPKRIKVGYTDKLGIEGEATSEIAKKYNAVAAINGGGFEGSTDGIAWTGTGGIPKGLLMSEGKIIHNDIKNHDEQNDVMAITEEGYLLVGKYSLNQLNNLNVSEVISFGPALIVNGEKTIKNGNGGWGIAPRTVLGQRKDGAMILLVIDGRRIDCLGATLKEVQDVLYDFGAYNAVNLDGGFSTTMYYNEKVINNPPDILGERCVPSIVYVEK